MKRLSEAPQDTIRLRHACDGFRREKIALQPDRVPADNDSVTFAVRRICLAFLVAVAAAALSGCWADSYDEAYCRENPYAEPCPLGQADEGGGETTTIEIYPAR